MKCTTCKGNGHVTVRMKDRSGRQPHGLGVLGICVCPGCLGKGHITDADRRRVQSVEQYNQIVG